MGSSSHLFSSFFFYWRRDHRDLHSFPTRRSSDLCRNVPDRWLDCEARRPCACFQRRAPSRQDRKSTRLNSSHANISYAVFCLKKKKNQSASIAHYHVARMSPDFINHAIDPTTVTG